MKGKTIPRAAAASLLVCLLAGAWCQASQAAAERRVLDYIRDHVQPGQPLVVSELYNQVFTQPDERQALDKLYRAFFRIPLFVAQYQQRTGRPPSLEVIAQQFDLSSPQAADVLLRVMESDPRVPRFITRDPKTGAITRVDIVAIQSDPRFGQTLERQLSGWEGKPAPDFVLPRLGGGEVGSASLRGKVALLYVWFTGCPPCMKETPELVRLQEEFGGRGLEVLGANADGLLGLGYDDAVRERYARAQKINFSLAAWTRQADAAWGSIAIFPTLFLMDRNGMILRHWVGYAAPADLRRALEPALEGAPARW